MTLESQVTEQLADLHMEEAELLAVLHEARARRMIKCHRCGKRTRVSKLVYIQTHYYIEPYSCTGGDYWREGEGQFECPKCGGENRLYKRPDVVALKRYFARVEETHDR